MIVFYPPLHMRAARSKAIMDPRVSGSSCRCRAEAEWSFLSTSQQSSTRASAVPASKMNCQATKLIGSVPWHLVTLIGENIAYRKYTVLAYM